MAMLKTPITPRDHRKGDPDATVILVEYGDYQCPYCALAQPVVRELLHRFGADLALVFRHFPISEAHPLAGPAAEAAEFAGDNDAFWEMHEALYANQSQLSLPVIFGLAGALGLSQTELQQALSVGTYAQKVSDDFLGGVRSGVNGTPCFFIDGVRYDGAHSVPALAAAIATASPARAPAARSVQPNLRP